MLGKWCLPNSLDYTWEYSGKEKKIWRGEPGWLSRRVCDSLILGCWVQAPCRWRDYLKLKNIYIFVLFWSWGESFDLAFTNTIISVFIFNSTNLFPFSYRYLPHPLSYSNFNESTLAKHISLFIYWDHEISNLSWHHTVCFICTE